MKTPKVITLKDYEEEYERERENRNAGNSLHINKSTTDVISDFLESENPPALIIKDAADWINEALEKPESKQLFGEFWFENEVCILFGDTGTGKSILAYQIADSISTGQRTPMTALQVPPQVVLYLDCELSSKQISKRYSDADKQAYPLSRNFKRAELDPTSAPPEGVDYDTHIVKEIEKGITSTSARILIVDNITYLRNDMEKAKDASGLMKQLKVLSDQHQLSILVLAHTPKRDLTKGLTRNDLAGSKMLINFCDSAIAIGESSHGSNMRYLLQIKERNTEKIYGPDNVILCSLSKLADNFLSFQFMGYSTEQEHLKEYTKKEKDAKIEQVKELGEKGLTQREIAAKTNLALCMVNKYLKM